MKRATHALRALLGRIAGGLGLEGAFLAVGAGLLAIGSSYLSPAGPWLVLGSLAVLVGIALAVPQRSR